MDLVHIGSSWNLSSYFAGQFTNVIWNSVAYSPLLAKWAAVGVTTFGGNFSSDAAWSLDGVNWTTVPTPNLNIGWTNVIWLPAPYNYFLAVSPALNQTMYSSDGLNWTLRVISVGTSIRALAYDGSNLVGAGYKGSAGSSIVRSTDGGVTWTNCTDPGNGLNNYQSIVWSSVHLRFVAVGLSGIAYSTAANGSTFAASTSLSYSWRSITFSPGYNVGQGLFVAVGAGITAASSDGITWGQYNSVPIGYSNQSFTSVVASPEGLLFAAVANSNPSRIMTSKDGFMWISQDPTTKCTTPIATPGIVYWTAHGFSANQAVSFMVEYPFNLPAGITPGVTYYVSATNLTNDSFSISATAGGSLRNFTGTSTGVQWGLGSSGDTQQITTIGYSKERQQFVLLCAPRNFLIFNQNGFGQSTGNENKAMTAFNQLKIAVMRLADINAAQSAINSERTKRSKALWSFTSIALNSYTTTAAITDLKNSINDMISYSWTQSAAQGTYENAIAASEVLWKINSLEQNAETCNASCTGFCQGCSVQCGAACASGCGGTCASGCFSACQIGCGSACQVTCSAACATSDCQNACSGRCRTNCGGNCTHCGQGCVGGCAGGCSENCANGGCEGGCGSCTVGCTVGCASSCGTACAGGCSVACQNGCGGACASTCGSACTAGCGGCSVQCYASCFGLCGGSCSNACGATCSALCRYAAA